MANPKWVSQDCALVQPLQLEQLVQPQMLETLLAKNQSLALQMQPLLRIITTSSLHLGSAATLPLQRKATATSQAPFTMLNPR